MLRSQLLPSIGAIFIATLSYAPAAVSTPYSQNFDGTVLGDTLVAEFLEGGSGTTAAGNNSLSTIGAGGITGQGYTHTLSGAANTWGVVHAPGVAGQSFSVSTSFTIESLTSSQYLNGGLVALSDASLTAGYRAVFLIGTEQRGRVELHEFGTGQGSITPVNGSTKVGNGILSSANITPTVGTVYELTLTGTYIAGTLNITASITDGTDTAASHMTDTSVITGDHFGYRTAAGGGALTVTYDDFSVIPEPAVACSALLGSGILLLGRRRPEGSRKVLSPFVS